MAPRWSLESSAGGIELSLDDDDMEDVIILDNDGRNDEHHSLHDDDDDDDGNIIDFQSDSDDIDSVLQSPEVSEADEINDDDENDGIYHAPTTAHPSENGDDGDNEKEAKSDDADDHQSLQSLTLISLSSSSSSEDGTVSDRLPVSGGGGGGDHSTSAIVSEQSPSTVSFSADKRTLKSAMKMKPNKQQPFTVIESSSSSSSSCSSSYEHHCQSARNRSVSFCPMASVLLYPHITEYSQSEIENTWYRSADLKQFRQICLNVADKLENSSIMSPSPNKRHGRDSERQSSNNHDTNLDDDDEFCSRGCEYMTRIGTMLRQKHRRDALRAVFDYQDAQRAKRKEQRGRQQQTRRRRHSNGGGKFSRLSLKGMLDADEHDGDTDETDDDDDDMDGHNIASFIDAEELAKIYATWTHHSQQVARIMGNIDQSAVMNIDPRRTSGEGSRQAVRTSSQQQQRSHNEDDERREDSGGQHHHHHHHQQQQQRREEHHEQYRKQAIYRSHISWNFGGVSGLFHHHHHHHHYHSNSSKNNHNTNGGGHDHRGPSSPLNPTSPPAFESIFAAGRQRHGSSSPFHR